MRAAHKPPEVHCCFRRTNLRRLAELDTSSSMADTASGCSWTTTSDNLNLIDSSADDRCEWRHGTLLEAKTACLGDPGCGGITQDKGMMCGTPPSKALYELRSNVSAHKAVPRHVQSWMRSAGCPFNRSARRSARPLSSHASLATWHCPMVARRRRVDKVPAFLVYAFGEKGERLAKAMFGLVDSESDVGDGYLIRLGGAGHCNPSTSRCRLHGAGHSCNASTGGCDQASRGPAGVNRSPETSPELYFDGPLRVRRCSKLQTTPWPTFPVSAKKHSARKYTLVKVELLRHLPTSLTSVVLLDADTHSMPGSGALFAEQIRLMRAPQFVAGSSGIREASWRGGPIMPSKWGQQLNSGVLAFDLVRFRAFEESFCPGRAWWSCLADSAPLCSWAVQPRQARGKSQRGMCQPSPGVIRFAAEVADQMVFSDLLAVRPEIFRTFPCGLHAETQVLQGLVNRCVCACALSLSCRTRASTVILLAFAILSSQVGPTSRAVATQGLRAEYS